MADQLSTLSQQSRPVEYINRPGARHLGAHVKNAILNRPTYSGDCIHGSKDSIDVSRPIHRVPSYQTQHMSSSTRNIPRRMVVMHAAANL